MSTTSEKTQRIQALEAEIETLKSQWPKHSAPPALMLRLDELEEALAEAQKDQKPVDEDISP